MASKHELLEIVKVLNDKGNESIKLLFEDAVAQVEWMKEVIENAKSLKQQGRESIRGDLVPKTPAKRGRKRKVITTETADDAKDNEIQMPAKKSVSLKECQVSLELLAKSSYEKLNFKDVTPMEVEEDQQQSNAVLTETKSVSNRSADETSVKQSPAKPVRKIKAIRNVSKENESPAKNVVPKGKVAAEVKLYEEKIIVNSPSPQKQLNKALSEVEQNQLNATILNDPNAVPQPSFKQVEAKVVELQIARMSITRQRSSRIRHKKSLSKAALSRKSVAEILNKSRKKSTLFVSPTSTVSPGFVTAENSLEIEKYRNDQSDAGVDVVNETQEDKLSSTFNRASLTVNEKNFTKSVSLATTTDDNVENCSQNDQVSDDDSIEIIMATPPKISTKSQFTTSKMNFPPCKVVITKQRLSPLPVRSGTGSSAKISLNKVFPSVISNNSFCRTNRTSSTSPGSLYKYGTPDKTLTPQHNTAKLQRMALLDARAASVLKKRNQYLKEKVESQKQKRELRNQRFLKSKEQLERVRAAKIEKLQEEERKKALLMQIKRRQAEAEARRAIEEQKQMERRMEEQKRLEQKRLEEQKLKKEQEETRKKNEMLEAKLAKEEQLATAKAALPVAECGDTFVKPTIMNSTYNAGNNSLNATYNADCYEMTPKVRPTKLANPDNYDIDNLNENDSTDEEDKPKKPIPNWAKGESLRSNVYEQIHVPPDFAAIFDKEKMFKLPDLALIFKTKRKRFHKRTSSAVWTAPPRINESIYGQ